MGNLFIQEIYVNKTQNCICGETEVYETCYTDKGSLFKELQKRYGKCISKMYHDDVNHSIGWVFEKKEKYTDCNEFYISETWVSIHTAQTTKTIKYHYA